MNWWVRDYIDAGMYIELVSWIFWLLFSITLHELAHGWTAIWQGDDTPIRLDHMSANPLVHLGPQSLLVFALCGIAWGQMPVNPSRFRNGRRGDLYVSAAGPAMNLAIALACFGSLVLWLRFGPKGSELSGQVAIVLFTGITLNLLLTFLNLVPLPPADGAHMLAAVNRKADELFRHPQAAVIGTFTYVAIIFMTPMGNLLWAAADGTTIAAVDGVGRPLGSPGLVRTMRSGHYAPSASATDWTD